MNVAARERREHRSDAPEVAIEVFLDAVRKKAHLEAIALTTNEGDLIAGGGHVDVERMGHVGAERHLSVFGWDERVLFVERLSVNGVAMFLTAAGHAVGPDVVASVRRILKHRVGES